MFRASSIYLATVFEGRDHLTGAEIGVLHGENAKELVIVLGSRLEKLYLVDPYIPYTNNMISNKDELLYKSADFMTKAKETARDLFRHDPRIEFIYQSSQAAAMDLMAKNTSLDFVYIDANHTTQAVVQDIQAWLPLLKEGGVLTGHDFNFKTVEAAVRQELGDTFFVLEDGINWAYLKPAAQ